MNVTEWLKIRKEAAADAPEQLAETLDSKSVSVFLQALAAVGLQESDKPILQSLIAKFNLDSAFLVSIFDSDTLVKLELVNESAKKLAVRAKQAFVYRQQKYNLIRENVIGYSLEISDLINIESANRQDIQNLIGQYDLDPYKTLYQLLAVMAADTSKYDVYLEFFKTTPWYPSQLYDPQDFSGDGGSLTVAQFLGFELLHSKDWYNAVVLIAKLIKDGVISMKQIYPYFDPEDETFASSQQWKKDLLAKASEGTLSALAMATSLDDDDDKKNNSGESDPTYDYNNAQWNQRIVLVEQLLKLDCTSLAKVFMEKFPFIVQASDEIALVLDSNLMNKLPAATDSDGDSSMYDLKEVLTSLEPELAMLGPQVGVSPELIVKLCSCLNALTDREFAIEFFRQWVLPGVSLLTDDQIALSHVWELLKTLSQTERYALYTEWQHQLPKRYPKIKYAVSKAEKQTKSVLKRLSNTNAEEMLRKLANISYANPLATFTVFVGQVESYDKMGTLLLEVPDMFSELGWDVLPLVILTQLSSGRSSTQNSRLHESKWMQALAKFTAQLATKSSNFDVEKIILYVLKQLHTNNFENLLLLKQIFFYMGGCILYTNVSGNHLELLSSGKPLREKALELLGTPKHSCPARLIDALKSVALELFVALVHAQMSVLPRYSPGDEVDGSKILAHQLDEITFIIQQYCTLISRVEYEEFKPLFGDMRDVCVKYHVPFKYAMALWRPFLAEEIRRSEASDGFVHPLAASLESGLAEDGSAEDVIPPTTTTMFSRTFYLTFWVLDTYDLTVFTNAYSTQHDSSTRLAKKVHESVMKKTYARLEHERPHWLKKPNETFSRRQQLLTFIADMVLPRAVNSPPDALTTFYLVDALYKMGTEHFNVLSFFDTLFSGGILYYTLATCTPYEAESLGVFLCRIWMKLKKWRSVANGSLGKKRSAYNDFLIKVLGERKTRTEDNATQLDYTATMMMHRDDNPGNREADQSKMFSAKEIRVAVDKWNRAFSKTLLTALTSGNYLLVQNAITILRATKDQVVEISSLGADLLSQVKKLAETESRDDLKLAATALAGQVEKLVKSRPQRVRNGDQSSNDTRKAAVPSNELSDIPATPKSVEDGTPRPENDESSVETTESLDKSGAATPKVATPRSPGSRDGTRTPIPESGASTPGNNTSELSAEREKHSEGPSRSSGRDSGRHHNRDRPRRSGPSGRGRDWDSRDHRDNRDRDDWRRRRDARDNRSSRPRYRDADLPPMPPPPHPRPTSERDYRDSKRSRLN